MNNKLLALALMVAGTTAACSPEAFERNVKLVEDFGNPPDPAVEQPQTTSPEGANSNPIPILEEPTDPFPILPCEPFTGEFRVWHCEDGWRMYP